MYCIVLYIEVDNALQTLKSIALQCICVFFIIVWYLIWTENKTHGLKSKNRIHYIITSYTYKSVNVVLILQGVPNYR